MLITVTDGWGKKKTHNGVKICLVPVVNFSNLLYSELLYERNTVKASKAEKMSRRNDRQKKRRPLADIALPEPSKEFAKFVSVITGT
jgi:hypothetical protein